MQFEGLKNAAKVCEALEQRLKEGVLKVPTIKESCEQALREHAAAKALREIGRRQELAKLQAEFDATEHGVDPASEESLARLAQHIREARQGLADMAAEHIGSPEHKLALSCLKALVTEYGRQDIELAGRRRD
jgi:hypothetical protein